MEKADLQSDLWVVLLMKKEFVKSLHDHGIAEMQNRSVAPKTNENV